MPFRPNNYIDPECRYDHLKRVEIVDAIMGRGKTTAAISYAEEDVRTNPHACWMVCCGPISEVETRPNENELMRGLWHRPERSKDAKNKEDSLIQLLQDPSVRLICLTHTLWKQATTNPLVLHLISRRRFNIVFDEVPDSFVETYTKIKPGDFRRAHLRGDLTVDDLDFGRVKWRDELLSEIDEATHVDSLVREQKRVRALVVKGQYTVLDMPYEGALKAFRRVIVTTYLAPRTVFTAYLDMHSIPWAYCTDVIPGRPMTKARIRGLVALEHRYDSAFGDWRMDSTWYKTASTKQLSAIGNAIRNMGDRHCEGNPERLAFTAKKKRVASTQTAPGIKARGYTSFLYEPGKPRVDDYIDKTRSCFIRCNAKASNEYRHKDVLVYAYNRFPIVPISRFFQHYGMDFDPDHFALTEMLQWVWRSAIRDGKPIHLAIPSARMRGLFEKWLMEDESNVVPFPVCSRSRDQGSANDQTMDEWIALYG